MDRRWAWGIASWRRSCAARSSGATTAPGSTLPKQDDLAAEFGVNVKTVRNAVALLEAEGLVTPVRRRGTVVRERPPMRRLGAERYSKSKWKFGDSVAFIADREASGQPWQRTDQTQTVELVSPPPRAVEVLGVEPDGQVYARARTREAGGPAHPHPHELLPARGRRGHSPGRPDAGTGWSRRWLRSPHAPRP